MFANISGRWRINRELEHLRKQWSQAQLPTRPAIGWIKHIRTGLSMPTRYLAQLLGVVPSTIQRLEKSEQEQTITLQSLQKVADALDCDFYYTLVPRKSVAETIQEKATELAKLELIKQRDEWGIPIHSNPQLYEKQLQHCIKYIGGELKNRKKYWK